MRSVHPRDPLPARPGRDAARLPIRPAALMLALTASLALTSCDVSAGQVRESAGPPAASPAAATPSDPHTLPARTPAAPAPDADPVPVETTGVSPSSVGVAGRPAPGPAGMQAAVQGACQWLLRQETGPMPGPDAGACVGAAMSAGTGGVQTLSTQTSWLPSGTYAVRFTTGSDFAMHLRDPDGKLDLTIRDGRRVLRETDTEVSADPKGTAEEAYAAVLADAAELTVRPERVAALLGRAVQLEVRYGTVLDGVSYTRLSGQFAGTAQEGMASETVIPEGSFTLLLDEYYRPASIDITGLNQGITSKITAVNAQWGTRPLS